MTIEKQYLNERYNRYTINHMVRKSEFDRDIVLDRAMECFHRYGYHGSSMQMLVDAMGIGRGSLYATFTNKQTLFEESMNRYGRALSAVIAAQLESAPQPLKMIRFLMRDLVNRVVEDTDHKGCLITNTAIELGGLEPELTKSIANVFTTVEDIFYRALVRAQENGELGAEKKPRTLARFLVSIIQGVRVVGKVNSDPAILQDIVEVALKNLD